MIWAWFIVGWVIAIAIVAPLLGRHFEELDDDWP
jgi:hypothetical protein